MFVKKAPDGNATIIVTIALRFVHQTYPYSRMLKMLVLLLYLKESYELWAAKFQLHIMADLFWWDGCKKPMCHKGSKLAYRPFVMGWILSIREIFTEIQLWCCWDRLKELIWGKSTVALKCWWNLSVSSLGLYLQQLSHIRKTFMLIELLVPRSLIEPKIFKLKYLFNGCGYTRKTNFVSHAEI